jgi:hypothetical protein
MCREVECKTCEYAENLKGCTEKHVGEARKLISKGDPEGADLQLSYIERHLKE